MEGGRAKKLLKSMSIKQGIKYDSPESARDIPSFIEFHNLNVEEILDPLSSFSMFRLNIKHHYRFHLLIIDRQKPSTSSSTENSNPTLDQLKNLMTLTD